MFKIRHFKGSDVTDEIWNHTLETAKDIVCKWVREGVVDRVEIRNENDELIFHYPRDMHA